MSTNNMVDPVEFQKVKQDISDMKGLMVQMVEAVQTITRLDERQISASGMTEKLVDRLEAMERRQHAFELERAAAGNVSGRVEQLELAVRELSVERQKDLASQATVRNMLKALWAFTAAGGFVVAWRVFTMPGSGRLMTMLTDLAWRAAGALIYLALMFVCGVNWEKRHQLAQRAAIAEKAVEDYKAEVARSAQISAKTEFRVQELRDQSAVTRQTLRTHLEAQRQQPVCPVNPETPDEPIPAPLLGQSVLDADTVRLLNDARGAATVPPAGGVDAQGRPLAAAETVTGIDLADSDADIAARYRELSERHNALVDYAERYERALRGK